MVVAELVCPKYHLKKTCSESGAQNLDPIFIISPGAQHPTITTAAAHRPVIACSGGIMATIMHSIFAPLLFAVYAALYSVSGVRDSRYIGVCTDSMSSMILVCLLLSAMALRPRDTV